jgi:hypothetical protein
MPRIGLVRFAAVALDVARAVVPDYRAPRSKHVFTQPQLLAVLCLMRYDDWTFRDAEIRLAEHAELRAALQLTRVPDHTTLWRFLDRVPLAVLQDLLAEVLRRCAPPSGPRGGRRRAVVAVDATGLTTGSVSTYFERRRQELTGQPAQPRALAEVARRARCGPAADPRADRPSGPGALTLLHSTVAAGDRVGLPAHALRVPVVGGRRGRDAGGPRRWRQRAVQTARPPSPKSR